MHSQKLSSFPVHKFLLNSLVCASTLGKRSYYKCYLIKYHVSLTKLNRPMSLNWPCWAGFKSANTLASTWNQIFTDRIWKWFHIYGKVKGTYQTSNSHSESSLSCCQHETYSKGNPNQQSKKQQKIKLWTSTTQNKPFSSYLEKAFSMLRSLNQAQRVPGTWFFAFWVFSYRVLLTLFKAD
jgi:hypothetical protein